MNYKLAKKLKDAGFPQTIKYDYAYKPTLSELIEACGRDFVSLLYVELSGTEIPGVKWEAWGDNKNYGLGISPEEAVSRLWLKLKEN